MKTCVFTVTIGEYYKNLAVITHPIIQRYADKIGADFLVADESDKTLITQKWNKFMIYQLLNKYDRFMLILI